MYGRCDECDQPQTWAGMNWHPHSEAQHAAVRLRLRRAMMRVLVERAAAIAGHRITLRFTATLAWAECSCGWRGRYWPDSVYASGDGHNHLADLGRTLVALTPLAAAP